MPSTGSYGSLRESRVVTGSSRGIGAAIQSDSRVRRRVVVHGRTSRRSHDRGRDEQSGGKGVHVTADVTKFAEIETMRDDVERAFGPIDILVEMRAAALPARATREISEEDGIASIDSISRPHSHHQSILPGMKQTESGQHHTVCPRRAGDLSPIAPSIRRGEGGNPDPYARLIAAQAGPCGSA